MRQKLELPEYETYEPGQSVLADPLVASFGEQALKSEQYILEEQSHIETIHADIAFLGSLAARKWWKTSVPSKDDINTWVQNRYETSDLSEAARTAEGIRDKATARLEKSSAFLREDLEGVRAQLTDTPEIEQEELSKKIDQTLDIFAVANDIEPQNIAFRQWKRQAERTEGRLLSWAEWMTRPSDTKGDELGTVDRQLLNFLHWNQYYYNATNMSEEFDKDLAEKVQKFRNGLYAATKADRLASELYAHAANRPQLITAGEVLDVMLFVSHGYSEHGKNEIVMSYPIQPGTYVHERIHPLGHFDDIFWNESATQLIADIVDEENESPKHESGYDPGVDTLRELMSMSGVSTKEMSSYFAREDLQGLLKQIGSGVDSDLSTIYAKIKEKVVSINDTPYGRQELLQGFMRQYVDYLKRARA